MECKVQVLQAKVQVATDLPPSIVTLLELELSALGLAGWPRDLEADTQGICVSNLMA